MRIAVVGAGIAGLACARGLADAGQAVALFESGDRPGGRVATLRTELGGFDHGAQYLTAREPDFAALVADWATDGITAVWPVRPASIGSASRDSGAGDARYVGVPGMAAIALRMADGLDLRCGAHVLAMERVDARWALRASSSEGDAGPRVEGLYDVVVVALPPIRAAALLADHTSLVRPMATVAIDPCWTLLAGFVEPVASPSFVVDAAFVAGSRLAWIAREASKPGRRAGERWTAQATPAWSREHFDDDPVDVTMKLVRAFQDATGTREQPTYAQVHRWREARVREPAGRDCLWDATLRLGACGDWCRGHRIEDAWVSGTNLARTIAG